MDESHTTDCESCPTTAAGQTQRVPARTVLLADGNRLTQRIAAHMLQTDGYQVTSVCTGEQLLAALRQSTFDLLLMDMEMLDVTVGEAISTVREREVIGTGRLSMIGMTSSTLQGESCLDVGMDQYIVKPLDLDGLRGVIASCATTTTLEPAFDQPAALLRLKGDRAFLCTLAALFIEESPGQLETLRLAVEGQDGKLISRAAHKLKGSASPFCAAKLSMAAQTIESTGESGQLANAADEYHRCEIECHRLLAALKEMVSHVEAQRVSDCTAIDGPEGAIPCTV